MKNITLIWKRYSHDCDLCGWSEYLSLKIVNKDTGIEICNHNQNMHTGNSDDINLFSIEQSLTILLEEAGFGNGWVAEYEDGELDSGETIRLNRNGVLFNTYHSDYFDVNSLLSLVLKDLGCCVTME